MRKYKIILCLMVLCFTTGCYQPITCEPGDDACYKSQYWLVPDANKASGYRYLTLGELLFGEKNQKK